MARTLLSLKSMALPDLISKLKLSEKMKTHWSSIKEFGKSLPSRLPTKEQLSEKLKALKSYNTSKLPQFNATQFTNMSTYMKIGATAAAAYFLADTASLFLDTLVPEPPVIPPPPYIQSKNQNANKPSDFSSITRRNIFNSKGIIPEDSINADPNGPARRSNLPLNLVGTVVLQDPAKSIASIEDKSTNTILPVRLEESINGKGTVKKIEHLRVTFINTSNGMLEYIEIPEDQLNNNITVRPSAISKASTGGIERDGENHVRVERKELDKAFGNLNEILTQARAIPNFENGVPNGYKIIQIVPNSIYTKLGINEGDVLLSVNGDPMTDPGKAFQFMNELRNGAGHVELSVKSADGKTRNLSYDIH